MSGQAPNLMLKYGIFGAIGCLAGVYISHYLGYNDGSMQAYLIGAVAGAVGGALGGKMRQNKGKTS